LSTSRACTGPTVMLRSAVMWGKRLKDWNTIPTLARRRLRPRPSSGSGRPSTSMAPPSMGSSRLMHRSSVDLPDPEGPTTTTTSRSSTSRSTSWSTCSGPNHLFTLCKTTTGAIKGESSLAPEMPDLMDTIVNLCKRRGIVFPSSEIYGGLRSTWDYGPLGAELKRNIAAEWWRQMVQYRDDVVGLDSAILMAPQVWQASGHLETFHDPLVECRNCNNRFRADHLKDPNTCPNCGQKGTFTDARQFNLMFKTYMGPVDDDAPALHLP